MIADRTEITALVQAEKQKGKTVVLTNGCFDILHAGHVRYLAAARAVGDCLVLGLNSDSSVRALKGPSRPINSELDRAEVIDGLRSVDYVVIFDETTAEALVRDVRPDYYAKGGDYSLDSLPEAKAVAECGGKVVFLPFVQGKSSTNIIQKIEQNAKE